jgi:polysaccharide pyruvyl transferase WcaK-like protein
VLIVGGDSDHNLGDQAILASLCGLLRAAEPQLRVTITSDRWPPGRFAGVDRVIPRGARSVTALARAARESDLVVVGGGGLFQDDDSRVKMPYWAARLWLLRRFNHHLFAHAVGAGPLAHAESRRFARMACGSLQGITVRDPFARDWLARCADRPVAISPDPAFALEPATPDAADGVLESLGFDGRPRLIGVAVRRWFHPRGGFLPHRLRSSIGLDRGHGDADTGRMLDQVAAAIGELARRLDAAVLLLPSYNVGHEADHRHCQALGERLGDVPWRMALLDDPRLYKAVCGRLLLMVSARMHPLILAAGMGVPGVALAYNGKFEGCFDMLGIPRRLAWLDHLRSSGQAGRLVALAEAALADGVDLRQRSAALAAQAASDVADLLAAASQPA